MGFPGQPGCPCEDAKLKPEQVDTRDLAPIFVPASFFSTGLWPGPYTRLRAAEIGLAWVVLLPGMTMRYVDFELQRHWEGLGIDWKALALRNLAEHSGDRPGSHALQRANGEVYSVAFMHPDTLGPSRLLLRDQLSTVFPEGYRVALPEMSCGFAFSVEVADQELATIRNLIDNCYRKGTRPLAPGIYAPEDLLPADN